MGQLINDMRFVSIMLFIAGFQVFGLSTEPPILKVKKIVSDIKIDGNLDESFWSECEVSDNFWLYFPTDSLRATKQTIIKMAFDDKHLYIGVINYHEGSEYVIPSLKRDFRAGGNDNISFIFDPFSDGINAFMFGINPSGVQREGLISGGGTALEQFSNSWDQVWNSATKINQDNWSAEVAIPFSSIRFNPASTTWRFNSYRFDMQSNERSTWTRIPRNQWIFNLGYMGQMEFESSIDNGGSKLSFIPYITGRTSKNYTKNISRQYAGGIGGDIKVALTPGLNLDMTFNPDFSQVEVDQQVTNIDRFEIFFPERRQFFLENEDLFGSYGFANINPFFSRRIGISTNPITKLAVQNPIYGGLRLSGKLNDHWRVGLLSMQTAETSEFNLPSFNHSMFSLQRRVGARSNFSAFFANKMSFDNHDSQYNAGFNRSFGLDYNFATAENTWAGKTFYHRSLSTSQKDDAFSHGFKLGYINQHLTANWTHEIVGKGYDATMGFVRRTDYKLFKPDFSWFFMSNGGKINRHGPNIAYEQVYQANLGLTDSKLGLGYKVEYLNNATLDVSFNKQFLYLFSNFDPTGTGKKPLTSGSEYNYYFGQLDFISDNSQKFFYRMTANLGQYFNGSRYAFGPTVGYRFEPKLILSLAYNYNLFDLKHLDTKVSASLVSTTIDLTFSKSLFWTTYVQYNSQIANTNINTRIQYRFAPVSDFFLVFTSNSFSGETGPDTRFMFQKRDMALVAKLTYWLNI